jgi:hypothetical protein
VGSVTAKDGRATDGSLPSNENNIRGSLCGCAEEVAAPKANNLTDERDGDIGKCLAA